MEEPLDLDALQATLEDYFRRMAAHNRGEHTNCDCATYMTFCPHCGHGVIGAAIYCETDWIAGNLSVNFDHETGLAV